jgi:uncharacterized protein
MNDNTEIIQKLYHHFAMADYIAVGKLFGQNIQWEQMAGFPDGGTYTSVEQIINNVFISSKQKWENWKAIVTALYGTGQFVFATGFYEAKNKKTGKLVKADFIHHYHFHNNKIVRFKQYTDTHLIANAMS